MKILAYGSPSTMIPREWDVSDVDSVLRNLYMDYDETRDHVSISVDDLKAGDTIRFAAPDTGASYKPISNGSNGFIEVMGYFNPVETIVKEYTNPITSEKTLYAGNSHFLDESTSDTGEDYCLMFDKSNSVIKGWFSSYDRSTSSTNTKHRCLFIMAAI